MIEVEVLLPPIVVGETRHETKGEIIELTEADVKLWEQGPNPVVKRVKLAEATATEVNDEPATTQTVEEMPKPAVKKR